MTSIDVWHIGVPVKDLETSLSFYLGLGFELIGRYQETMAFVRPPGKVFTLELMEMQENDPRFTRKPDHLAFECADLDAFRDRVRDAPEIAASHSGLRLFELKDPDGIRVQFFSGRKGFDASIAHTKENTGVLS